MCTVLCTVTRPRSYCGIIHCFDRIVGIHALSHHITTFWRYFSVYYTYQFLSYRNLEKSDVLIVPLKGNLVVILIFSCGCCWRSAIFCLCSCRKFQGKDPNQHKRVFVQSNPGFLERLSETAGGTVVGVGLFFLSIYVLFTNEVRNVHIAEERKSCLCRSHFKPKCSPIKVSRLCDVTCWCSNRLLSVSVCALGTGLANRVFSGWRPFSGCDVGFLLKPRPAEQQPFSSSVCTAENITG